MISLQLGNGLTHKHYPATSQGVRRYSVTVTDPVSTKFVTTLMLPADTRVDRDAVGFDFLKLGVSHPFVTDETNRN